MLRINQVLAHKGRHIERIEAEASVAEAVARMNVRRIGSVLVTRDDVLVGILTERDVLVRVVGEGRDPLDTEVGDVMTRELVTVALDTPLHVAMQLVTELRCRHLPVLDEGRLVGLVSGGDLTASLLREQERTIFDLQDYITH